MIRDEIKKMIVRAIKQAQKDKNLPGFEMPLVHLEHPENEEFGDYSTNVALILSGQAKRPPMEIAKDLKIEADFIKQTEIVKPGFINFYLQDKYLQQQIKEIIDQHKHFGQLKDKKEKVSIDMISANPTGALHIGNGRGAFFGDVLANILNKAGYSADREYYINDAKTSKQINELGKTALNRGQVYKNKYLEKKIDQIKDKLAKIKDEAEAGYLLAQAIQKDNQEFIEEKLKIKINKWFSEQKGLYKKNKVEQMLEDLKKKDLTYEKDKAVWLKTTKYGDSQDWVLVRKDGQPSYLLADIAYHADKIERGYDKLIDIWGADHQGHKQKMKAVAKILDYQGDLDILITQIVHIKEGKLSKRQGQIISLESLVDEVGLDAVRFIYLSKSLDAQMEFDLNLAKEQSQKNPVYYVQYAYARICSIFRKTAIEPNTEKLDLLKEDFELNLIKQLIKFPEIIEDIAKDYQIQHLPYYAMELSATFHQFYKNCQVLGDDKELSQARLALAKATQIVLKNTLSLMGLNTPEKM